MMIHHIYDHIIKRRNNIHLGVLYCVHLLLPIAESY